MSKVEEKAPATKSPYLKASEAQAYMPFVDYDDDDAVMPEKVMVSTEDLTRIISTLLKYENMEGDTFRAMNLGNATPEFLVDELKGVRDQLKPRQTYEKLLSGILKDNHRPESKLITTEKNVAEFQWMSKRIIDKEAVAKYLAGEIEANSWDDLCKDSNYWQIKIKAIV